MANYSDITSVLAHEIEAWDNLPVRAAVGTVIDAGDGVATTDGLDRAVYGELIEFYSPTGEKKADGIVMNLNEETVGVVMLEGSGTVKAGDEARGTGRVVSVPVGEAVVGRVLNPLGHPIDGRGALPSGERFPVEAPAYSVIDRGAVNTPLETGILSIDSMIPIGRGQRELIIGDRQTGKTSIALDTIINQKGKGCYCVYCSIGQKSSSVAALLKTLSEHGAMDYTWIVHAAASDSAALQYIAPYSACAMAEYFMKAGKDVLVVYDDLSKHAVAYRAISLLLRRPPGREAFPGDVFYLHSRLLERAAKLSPEKGGGSITALPIIETQAGDISSYIPTNVISITDGQIFLDSNQFNAGFRPAVDVGLSVSRVGGSAQFKAVRKLSGQLRLDLAQYREMAAFAQFSSDLDADTRKRVRQGERLMESLKQNVGNPFSMIDEALMLYIATKGFLSNVYLEKVHEFLGGFISYAEAQKPDVVKTIADTREINEDSDKALTELADEYAKGWKNE
jgi:F-type H+-transporting ATPase subunit alpha